MKIKTYFFQNGFNDFKELYFLFSLKVIVFYIEIWK